MKHIFLLLAVMTMAVPELSAQITLTLASYPSSVIGTDSLKTTTYASAFPSLSAMPDGTWDLSAVTDTAPIFFAYRVPTVTYQFADSNTYNLGGYLYQGNVQSSITETGVFEYGLDVQSVAYNIYSATSGPFDSFFISTQSIAYSIPRTKIGFPTNYHSFWSSDYKYNFNFQLSVSILGLLRAPGQVRTHLIEKDSVIGWGKMRVKNIGGSPSEYFDVLQVQTVTTGIDSFYINGIPATASLLTLLNVSQGQKTTTYEQNYYRVNEVTPLANVQFRDSTYTTPYKATTHVQRIETNAVKQMATDAGIKVYPNPVTNRVVFVALPFTEGKWTYELIDINGKKSTAGKLKQSSTTQVVLPSEITAGIYYVKVMKDDKQVCIKPVEIVR